MSGQRVASFESLFRLGSSIVGIHGLSLGSSVLATTVS